MSDKDTSTAAANGASQFTERELQLLGWAMQSLKSGPPEIDYEKLASFAGMGNPRSASNAWAKIKGKLMTPSDGTAPVTPKKGGARKKVAKDDDGEEGEATPEKTPRKRTAKKQEVDGESPPKKKGARSKKASADEAKDESDTPANDAPVKTEPTEDNIGDNIEDNIEDEDEV